MKPFKHILVPVDFGVSSDAALDVATSLAQKYDAELTVAHVYEPPYVYAYGGVPFMPIVDLTSQLEKAADAGVKATVERVQTSWPRVTGVVRSGNAWKEIDALAAAIKADLIVMGTHGRTGLSHALLGSTAEKVVRTSPVPVLTVRASNQAEKAVAHKE